MAYYALRHGEHQIPNRSGRRRMEMPPPASSRTRTARTPQAARLEGDPRRRLPRAKERLPVAAFAPRVPALEDGLRLVQEVAHRRDLRALERRFARASTVPPRQGAQAQRGHRGFSVGEDLGGGRPRKSAASTPPRRMWKAESAICSSTPRVWCSKPSYIAPESARVPDADGIRLLLKSARVGLSRLSHLWVDMPATRGGARGGPRRRGA